MKPFGLRVYELFGRPRQDVETNVPFDPRHPAGGWYCEITQPPSPGSRMIERIQIGRLGIASP